MKAQHLIAGLILCALVVFASDEVSVDVELEVSNGEFQYTRDTGTQSYDQSDSGAYLVIQSIGTAAHEEITLPADIGNAGWGFFRNLDTNAASYIDLGSTEQADTNTFVSLIRLEATESAVFRLHPTNRIWAVAGGNESKLECWVNED